MFEVGFSEILVIFVLALVVLGPEKLPKVAAQVGRWVGRARGMARQFREQLEEEVQYEEQRKLQQRPAQQAPEPLAPVTSQPSPPPAEPEPQVTYPDTYSHAHPTDSLGRPVPSVEPETQLAQPVVDSRQQDWVGGLDDTEHAEKKPPQDAAYAPTHERGT
jgi:sec-independent protein translocase protein TatB